MELSPKGATPSARAKHSFVQIREKEYLLIGGEDNKDNNSQDILIYHPGLFINLIELYLFSVRDSCLAFMMIEISWRNSIFYHIRSLLFH